MPPATKSACLEDLRRRILSLDLKPGADLDETTLSAEYGISRTPLREVLQRLAGEGYVSQSENRGAKVAAMDIATMRVFFQTAPMVYANMAYLAAQNRTAAQLEALRAHQAEFTAATRAGDAERTVLANHRFHEEIGRMAANPYLMASLNRLLIDHARLSQTFYRPADPQEAALVHEAAQQHDAMIAAIDAGEATLALELTLKHWDLSKDRLERFVHPDPLPADVISLKDHRNAV